MIPCRLVQRYQQFRGACCFHHQVSPRGANWAGKVGITQGIEYWASGTLQCTGGTAYSFWTTLKMEEASSFQMLVPIHISTFIPTQKMAIFISTVLTLNLIYSHSPRTRAQSMDRTLLKCLVKYKGFQSILIIYREAHIWRVISDGASRNNFASIKAQL